MACDVHGKVLYPSRRAAKRANRIHAERMSVYVCDAHPGYYHVGHLSPAVIAGHLSRAELRERAAAEAERRIR